MRTNWIVGFVMLFFIGTVISLTLELQYLGTDTTDNFLGLMRPDFGAYTNPLTAVGGFFIMVWSWVQAFWKMVWWDYSFFSGYWVGFKYLGWTISIGIIFSLVLAVRGVGSS